MLCQVSTDHGPRYTASLDKCHYHRRKTCVIEIDNRSRTPRVLFNETARCSRVLPSSYHCFRFVFMVLFCSRLHCLKVRDRNHFINNLYPLPSVISFTYSYCQLCQNYTIFIIWKYPSADYVICERPLMLISNA